MSNNNNPKPAMMAVVSAAQKSVNGNNALSKNSNMPQAIAQPKGTLMNSIPSQKNITEDHSSDSQKNILLTEKESIKKALNSVTHQQDEIIETIQSPNMQSSKIPSKTNKDVNFNQHLVSLLCDGIRNVQSQAFDFTEKLHQSRNIKQKSLTHIQTITCDNIHALSNTCIDVAQKSLKTINPLDLIKNQTQGIVQMHTLCTNMVSAMSQTSLDIMKQSCTFSWFLQRK